MLSRYTEPEADQQRLLDRASATAHATAAEGRRRPPSAHTLIAVSCRPLPMR